MARAFPTESGVALRAVAAQRFSDLVNRRYTTDRTIRAKFEHKVNISALLSTQSVVEELHAFLWFSIVLSTTEISVFPPITIRATYESPVMAASTFSKDLIKKVVTTLDASRSSIPLEHCGLASSNVNLIPLSTTQTDMCPRRNMISTFIEPGQSQSSLVITSENPCGGPAHDRRRLTTLLPRLVLEDGPI